MRSVRYILSLGLQDVDTGFLLVVQDSYIEKQLAHIGLLCLEKSLKILLYYVENQPKKSGDNQATVMCVSLGKNYNM